MKMKEKYIKRSCGLLAITMCLSVILSCFCGCYKSGPKFYNFRANWIYEGDDITFTITTHGDRFTYSCGKIIIGEKTINVIVVASVNNSLGVYENIDTDISNKDWRNGTQLFFCSYKGYANEVTLSNFKRSKAGEPLKRYDGVKIVLKRYDY